MAEAGTTPAGDAQAADLSSNEPELIYTRQRDLAYRRKLGQFFTPFSVASFMSQWLTGVSASEPRVLDPCAGLGVFARALRATNPDFAARARFDLWEKDEGLARDLAGICERLAVRHSVTAKDFLDEHGWSAAYDAVVANPPYYKHHYVDNKEGLCSLISAKVGAPFRVQTNVYCWFLIKALSLLRPGGRLAFIVPTEFLNANYGQNVKKHLLDDACIRHIISVCYRSRTFDEAITTACILLAEKATWASGKIRFYCAESIEELGDLNAFLDHAEYAAYEAADLDVTRKWRPYFPGKAGPGLVAPNVIPFSAYGRFSRGIATGANEFFAISASRARALRLPDASLIPCVCKARQAPGKRFKQDDFESLRRADERVLLFDGEAITRRAVEAYIRAGEASGYQHRYLTRTRNPWYALERRMPAKIWAGVFGRGGIRFVWNESRCLTLTCFHVYRPTVKGVLCLPFLFLYLNSSIGLEFLELEKREYGDGLDKYEPNDINNALAPDFERLHADSSKRLTVLQQAFMNARRGSSEERDIIDEADLIFRALIKAS